MNIREQIQQNQKQGLKNIDSKCCGCGGELYILHSNSNCTEPLHRGSDHEKTMCNIDGCMEIFCRNRGCLCSRKTTSELMQMMEMPNW